MCSHGPTCPMNAGFFSGRVAMLLGISGSALTLLGLVFGCVFLAAPRELGHDGRVCQRGRIAEGTIF